MGISRVSRNDMTLIYLNDTIQNVILNIVLIKKQPALWYGFEQGLPAHDRRDRKISGRRRLMADDWL